MVFFQCELCHDQIKKPKIKKHLSECATTQFSCIDCSQKFDRVTVNNHTACISETEQTQKHLKSPDAKKAGKQTPRTGPVQVKTDAVPATIQTKLNPVVTSYIQRLGLSDLAQKFKQVTAAASLYEWTAEPAESAAIVDALKAAVSGGAAATADSDSDFSEDEKPAAKATPAPAPKKKAAAAAPAPKPKATPPPPPPPAKMETDEESDEEDEEEEEAAPKAPTPAPKAAPAPKPAAKAAAPAAKKPESDDEDEESEEDEEEEEAPKAPTPAPKAAPAPKPAAKAAAPAAAKPAESDEDEEEESEEDEEEAPKKAPTPPVTPAKAADDDEDEEDEEEEEAAASPAVETKKRKADDLEEDTGIIPHGGRGGDRGRRGGRGGREEGRFGRGRGARGGRFGQPVEGGDGEAKTGTMANWNDEKGFGFIHPDDGSEDIFCHRSALAGEFGDKAVTKGEPVEFTVVPGNDGRTKAGKVTKPGGEPFPLATGGGGGGRGGGRRESFGGGRGGGSGGGATASDPSAKTGTIANWNDEKGFGFIRPDDGSEDIFCHRNALAGDFGDKAVTKGEPVEFTVVPGNDGRTKAGQVTKPGGEPFPLAAGGGGGAGGGRFGGGGRRGGGRGGRGGRDDRGRGRGRGRGGRSDQPRFTIDDDAEPSSKKTKFDDADDDDF